MITTRSSPRQAHTSITTNLKILALVRRSLYLDSQHHQIEEDDAIEKKERKGSETHKTREREREREARVWNLNWMIERLEFENIL